MDKRVLTEKDVLKIGFEMLLDQVVECTKQGLSAEAFKGLTEEFPLDEDEDIEDYGEAWRIFGQNLIREMDYAMVDALGDTYIETYDEYFMTGVSSTLTDYMLDSMFRSQAEENVEIMQEIINRRPDDWNALKKLYSGHMSEENWKIECAYRNSRGYEDFDDFYRAYERGEVKL